METTEEELKKSQNEGWDSLVLTRDETKCRDKDLEKWKTELKGVLSRIISSKLEQISKSDKLKETEQNIVDAFLVVLGHRTKKDQKQVLKDFRANKIDLLKQVKLVKYEEITLDDCKQIQSLLLDVISGKTEDISTPFKDMAKWVSNLVEMKIASERFSFLSTSILNILSAQKKESMPKYDDIHIEELKPDEPEDWSKIGYIEQHFGIPYEFEQLQIMNKKLNIKLKKSENIDYDKTRPPESVIYFFNLLLVLCGKEADRFWNKKTGFTNNLKTIKSNFSTFSNGILTYPQMKAIKSFFDKYPNYDITIYANLIVLIWYIMKYCSRVDK